MSDTIREYVERVEKLRQARESRISEEELQQIARDVGLSEEDLAEVEREIQNHYDRGNGFVDHEFWDDAVRELSEAAALAPTRVYIIYALANAHFGRLASRPSDLDRSAAEHHARICLELDANYQPAYALLSKIREVPVASSSTTSVQEAPPAVRTSMLVGLISLALLLMGGVVLGVMTTLMTDGDAQIVNGSRSLPVAPVVTKSSAGPTGGEAKLGEFGGGLPVEIVPTDVSRGFVVNVYESDHSVYEDKSFYSLKATLHNASGRELSEVEGTMRFYDAAGSELASKALDVHSTTGGEMRPGDSAPFYTTISAPAASAKMTLEMHTVKATPAPATYDPGSKLVPEWKATKPGHLQLEIWQRSSVASDNAYVEGKYWKHQLAVVNTGDAPIKTLKVEAVYQDNLANEIGSDAWLIAFSGSPPLMPGETWSEGGVRKVPENYAGYMIRIVEIE